MIVALGFAFFVGLCIGVIVSALLDVRAMVREEARLRAEFAAPVRQSPWRTWRDAPNTDTRRG